MNLCTFSSQAVIEEKITLDNLFVQEFMPSAPENCTKVYLLGLLNCKNSVEKDNSLDGFSKTLGISVQEIEDCFYYWKQQGLVQVLDTIPMQVKYLPVNSVLSSIKKYKKEKYENFNIQLQEIIKNRMITPTEYGIYYDLIEREHFEIEALLMIIKYCVTLKGANVGHAYITTVARNWASENLITSEKVEQHIKEHENTNSALGKLLKVLSIKRLPQIEERDIFGKWKNEFNFDDETILQVAKQMKNKKMYCSFIQLNKQFEKYYQLQLLTNGEIENYEKEKENFNQIAITILKKLGIYYSSLEQIIESYILPWTLRGYNKNGLEIIADFCFLRGYKTLASMNNFIEKLFKLGVVGEESIQQYFNAITENDNEIQKILSQLNIQRNVNTNDRTFYKIWTQDWQIGNELLNYAISVSKDKFQPITYLNRMLSNFHENNVKDVESAKELGQTKIKMPQKEKRGRSYSKEELNSLFDSIEEIEV